MEKSEIFKKTDSGSPRQGHYRWCEYDYSTTDISLQMVMDLYAKIPFTLDPMAVPTREPPPVARKETQMPIYLLTHDAELIGVVDGYQLTQDREIQTIGSLNPDFIVPARTTTTLSLRGEFNQIPDYIDCAWMVDLDNEWAWRLTDLWFVSGKVDNTGTGARYEVGDIPQGDDPSEGFMLAWAKRLHRRLTQAGAHNLSVDKELEKSFLDWWEHPIQQSTVLMHPSLWDEILEWQLSEE